ncbi:helix-turn-helix transcriptional regulator [Photobacterium atrarenae]|uniref:Helix-turn-helix domain-containing protein n=1 Tax=Photobacterium atrarenae TaxID=865757 RepID=A0ABY5GI72_9GAMM|nr:helix-turn-helix transcriptional regulator [Photobacterium atrarenae]UTV28969.1 helix-turn-helix domain-containing protein [Photobacterium atrarenae]
MNRISDFRDKAKVSQAGLAKVVGVTPSTIGNYESGIRNIKLKMCWKIVKALNALGANCTFEEVFPNPQHDTSEIEHKG